MRQKGDEAFQDVLEKVRKAKVEDDSALVSFIKRRLQTAPTNCVKLYVTNKLATKANEEALNALPGELIRIDAVDYPKNNRTCLFVLKKESKLLSRLFLK